MSRHLIRPALVAGLMGMGTLALAGASHAAADREKVNMVIIYGDDRCPESAGDQITVCARKAESERYRIPEEFRGQSGPQNEAWNQRVIAYESVGSAGTNSCSPVGAGGWTGCAGQFIKNAYAERKQRPEVQFSKMIEAEREKRLSTIDADAAKQQADVEQEEAAIDARRKAEAAKKDAAPASTPATEGK
ncbi:MAG TPA: hypothetical protein VN222_03925 [Novosphingobium sp.]|nr:hypothetical protein [Novosphingobium sp.]